MVSTSPAYYIIAYGLMYKTVYLYTQRVGIKNQRRKSFSVESAVRKIDFRSRQLLQFMAQLFIGFHELLRPAVAVVHIKSSETKNLRDNTFPRSYTSSNACQSIRPLLQPAYLILSHIQTSQRTTVYSRLSVSVITLIHSNGARSTLTGIRPDMPRPRDA